MNTMLRSSTPQQSALAPSSLTTTRGPVVGGNTGVHRGVWIGGGLMALTIIALATTLVVKSNSSTPAPLVSPVASTTIPSTITPDASTIAPAPVVVAQAPAVVPAPVAAPVVHTVHHTPTHSYSNAGNGGYSTGNTQVATANTAPAPAYEAPRVAAAPVCTSCGVIDSYDAVQVAGEANGVGAVAGGVGGAVLGSKIAGRSNHTLGGIIGAVGGGLLGNAIEKHERTTTQYDVHVRMNDGSMRTVRQTTVPNVGAHVSVEGNSLRSAPSQTSSNYGSSNSGSSNSQSGYAQSNGNGGSSFTPSGN